MIKITVRHSQRANATSVSSISSSGSDQQHDTSMSSSSSSSESNHREPNSIVEIKYRQSTSTTNSSKQAHKFQQLHHKEQTLINRQASNKMNLHHRDQNERELKQQQQPSRPRQVARPIYYSNPNKNQMNQKTRAVPRGSLSSCSSSSPELSGAEEAAEYYKSYLTASAELDREHDDDDDDDDDDYCSIEDTGHSSVFEEPQLKPRNDSTQVTGLPSGAAAAEVRLTTGLQQQLHLKAAATGVKGTRTNRNKLHTRSVSLIVNPNFGLADNNSSSGESAEDDEKEEEEKRRVAKFKRRNSIVPSRLAHKQTRPLAPRYSHLPPPPPSSSGTADIQLKQKLANETVKSCVAMDQEAREINVTSCVKSVGLEVKTDSSTNYEQDQTGRLREIGFILRQISDEFSRNRRLTI